MCQPDPRCNKTAWLGVLYYAFATLFAQLVITLRLVTPSHYALTAYYILRVYAVTGKNRWIASCLYFMGFAQAAFGIANSVHYALHPGTISRLALQSKLETQISEATELPNLPFDEYRTCNFQPRTSSE